MRYTAAYLLAVLGGNASPDVASIAKILDSVGIECDEKHAEKVVDACKGKNVDGIIAGGMKKIDDLSSTNTSLPTPSPPEPPRKPVEPPKSPGTPIPTCDCIGECHCGGDESGMFDLFG